MIPRLDDNQFIEPAYHDFAEALTETPYSGDCSQATSEQTLMATDNSIYQLTPQIVLHPKTQDDIVIILSLANKNPSIHVAAKGGGTGTDGQSLTDGICIDCSKYMNNIIEINIEEKWVRVQPGVIVNELNETLKPHGLHFPVNISTGNRATLGGMVNTDACGQGSLKWGRTSDHLLKCEWVLGDGSIFTSVVKSINTLNVIEKKVLELLNEHRESIKTRYPALPRHATGYNLADIHNSKTDNINFNYLMAGSEGSLGIATEITLMLQPRITQKQLVLIHYPSFDAALKEAENLNIFSPLAIEVMDEKLMALVKTDALYPAIAHLIDESTKTISLVELEGDDITVFLSHLTHAYVHITDKTIANVLWQCRKNSVGLLGKSDNYKRAIPFIEDATVHPKDLAPFIRDLQHLLDDYGLDYGMFGHADAGCIHVRPALNLLDTHDETLLKEISEKTFALTKQYGGVLWGEHGLGFRSAYNPDFFGEKLYHAFRQIKTLFDPKNHLNPGKVATPLGFENTLYGVDGPLRAHRDRTLDLAQTQPFNKSLHCNGNGLCFNYAPNDTMCPSYKATRDRKHSPKGRAMLLREWLTQISAKGYDLSQAPKRGRIARAVNSLDKKGEVDFSHDVFNALDGCLGCKGCQTQCPIQVSIPEMKSFFLQQYYGRYLHPLKDFFISRMESISVRAVKNPALWNRLHYLVAPLLGLCDIPTLYQSTFKTTQIDRISKNAKTILLLQDALTRFYEPRIIHHLERLLKKLGYTLTILPFKPSGKAEHVLGYRDRFNQTAQHMIAFLRKVHHLGMPIISIDPSITLTYRDEYKSVSDHVPSVLLLQEWLTSIKHDMAPFTKNETYYLFAHCTEKTASLEYINQWKAVFAAFNLTLEVVPTGCCGMAGAYGLTRKYKKTSKKIYDLSWRAPIETLPKDRLLATGFSCRCQAQRFSQHTLRHPVEVLSKK